jgi:hypothetical protein
MRIVYPRQDDADTRDRYKIELLQLALDATLDEFGPYVLDPSASVMTELRMDALMTRGDGTELNLIFKPTTLDREQSMVPVRIPILKGLLGYRVFLVHADSQPAFSAVRTLDDLRNLTIGQGLGWRDVEVFAHNNVPVATHPDYERLFALLDAKRFDGFCRGITEAPAEFAERRDLYPSMRIESSLLLYYPWPVYFFAMDTDEGHAIAVRLLLGLEKIAASGQFDALFSRYYGGSFAELRLGSRRLIRLENPLLPPQTSLDNPQLWLTLEQLEDTP